MTDELPCCAANREGQQPFRDKDTVTERGIEHALLNGGMRQRPRADRPDDPVDGGTFTMEPDSGVRFPEGSERPVHKMAVDRFYIDKYSVPNA